MSRLSPIATAVPAVATVQADSARVASRLTGATERRSRAIERLYSASGVGRRHLCVASESGGMPFFSSHTGDSLGPATSSRLAMYERIAPELAREASGHALDYAGVDPSEISHLVLVSCTGMSSPGVDHSLIESLGLSGDVQRTCIGFMGCHGGINGLRVADALARSSEGRVLLCCVELCSLHFQYQPGPGAATANALFADGAAACVVSPRVRGSAILGFGSRFFADTHKEMSWRVADHGFEMTLLPSVPGSLREAIADWVHTWLASESLTIDDVDHWVIHPGGPKIVDGVLDGLSLKGEKRARAEQLALNTLDKFGNMSSPTVLFMIKELESDGITGTIVCLAFGPGLSGEATLIRA